MSPSAPTAELERLDTGARDHADEAQAALATAELELGDATTALLPRIDADAPERAFARAEATEAALNEFDPTTVAIPQATSALPVVLDEPVAATRTIESLTMTSRRAKLALATLAVAAFAFGVNEGTVVAMSAPIAASLGVPVSSIGILATAFALTVVIAAIPLALATRRWSRRTAVTGAIATWTLGVAVAASATSLPMLITGRVVTAAAHALFWAIVAPTAASLFAPHLRARTVTAIMLGAAGAGVLGTPIVTWAGTAVGWQAPYWGLTAMGALLACAALLTMPAVKALGPISGTVGDLPSGRAFARVLAVAFLVSVGMSVTWTYIVPFYTDVAGLPSGMLPALFALGGTLAVAATLGVGRYLVRHAVHTVAVGAGLIAAAWGLLGVGAGWSAVAGQAVVSTGWAVVTAGLLTWAMRHTPWRTEMGAGAYTVTMNAGASVGPLLGAALVASLGARWLPLVSLVLTVAAVCLTVTVDRAMVRRLAVPRRVRLRRRAREQRQAYQREQRKARAASRAASRPATRPARPVRSISPAALRRWRGEWSRRVEDGAEQSRASARQHAERARRRAAAAAAQHAAERSLR
ncbi:MFS transporter [Demequina sp. NBRC 110053]|uniref:MFS transporter n=1 Tax=Demequina sp. NBRC 110053 TaxID=1570342 RepID=UPI000A0200D1|nr:MFS transporter [Demequina sp. NBRC 110053]